VLKKYNNSVVRNKNGYAVLKDILYYLVARKM